MTNRGEETNFGRAERGTPGKHALATGNVLTALVNVVPTTWRSGALDHPVAFGHLLDHDDRVGPFGQPSARHDAHRRSGRNARLGRATRDDFPEDLARRIAVLRDQRVPVDG